MSLLSITSPGFRISLQREHLIVSEPESPSEDQRVPLADVERVILNRNNSVTTPALMELLDRKIPILFENHTGHLLGSFEPPAPPRALTRTDQYRLQDDTTRKLQFSRCLIHAKIRNQHRVLQRLNYSRNRLDEKEIAPLLALSKSAGTATESAELLGIEGAASARWWKAWAIFLPDDAPFANRSTRPPKNAVNAVISYLSTLIYGEAVSACLRTGLDPALGCFHTADENRWSLALDLMEPFRPAFSDALTLRLFTHRILRNDETFFTQRDGGVFLSALGKKRLFPHYRERIDREFLSTHAGHRTTIRKQIAHMATQYKIALPEPETYTAFLVN